MIVISVGHAEKAMDLGNAVSILRGEKKNIRRKEKRARIEQIRISLGLADSQRTPVVFSLENLAHCISLLNFALYSYCTFHKLGCTLGSANAFK